ncbi:MAG: PRK06851 family protein [Negativicutes bacterium]|nr:PRK06851 family protein [Negativicutes bacterium]
MGRVRHLFPGGNTPQGFFSYYSYIIPINANRIFVLKGGPGTGKSTFMRKIGEAMVSHGYDVEYHHCSSDCNSLDGVVIPAMQVAFIDGTAPHVVDPKNPGCVDEIIHLGDFWDEKRMIRNKDKVISINAEIATNFQRAYRLLRAAKSLYDDWEAINYRGMNFALANRKAEELSARIFAGVNTIGAGQVRKLFASAITPDGPVNYLESSVWPVKECYVLTGDPGTGKSTVIQKLLNTAMVKGLNVEAFYCPLDPEKIEHLVIPALDIAVTTSVLPHYCGILKPAAVVDMNECLRQEHLAQYQPQIAYDREVFWELFTQAVNCIRRAKSLHDELETCYIPNMDFVSIQKLWEKTLERVLSYHIRN